MPARAGHRHAARLAARSAGFTLIELMVTMTVLIVLMAVAVPSFNNAVLGSKLSGYANNFVASVQLARSEAIKRNAPITMCRSADGSSCASSGGWQQGWIIFNDKDSSGAINGDETRIHYQQALASEFAFTGDVYTIVFQGSGLNSTPVTNPLVLCRASPAGSQERAITVSTTGRAASNITHNGTCPT